MECLFLMTVTISSSSYFSVFIFQFLYFPVISLFFFLVSLNPNKNHTLLLVEMSLFLLMNSFPSLFNLFPLPCNFFVEMVSFVLWFAQSLDFVDHILQRQLICSYVVFILLTIGSQIQSFIDSDSIM